MIFKTSFFLRKISPAETFSNFASRIQSQISPHELNESSLKSKNRFRLRTKEKSPITKTEPSLLNSFISPDKTREGLAKFSLIYYPPSDGIDPSKTFNSFNEMLSTNKDWTKEFNEPFSEVHMVSQQLYHNVKQRSLIDQIHKNSFNTSYTTLFTTLQSLDQQKKYGYDKVKIYTNDKDKDMKAMLAVKKLIESSEKEQEEASSEQQSLKIRKNKAGGGGLEQLENLNLHFKFYWYKINNVEFRPENREGATLSFVGGKGYLYGGKARKLHEGIVELDTSNNVYYFTIFCIFRTSFCIYYFTIFFIFLIFLKKAFF